VKDSKKVGAVLARESVAVVVVVVVDAVVGGAKVRLSVGNAILLRSVGQFSRLGKPRKSKCSCFR